MNINSLVDRCLDNAQGLIIDNDLTIPERFTFYKMLTARTELERANLEYYLLNHPENHE